MHRIIIILLFGSFLSGVSAATQKTQWGEWIDKENNSTFAFMENNVLKYSEIKKVFVKYSGITPWMKGIHSNGQYVSESVDFEGAWETGKNICPGGNLRYYLKDAECCMNTRKLGNVLILKNVASVNDTPALCRNRTLHRQEDSE